jgi:hypothetical protein
MSVYISFLLIKQKYRLSNCDEKMKQMLFDKAGISLEVAIFLCFLKNISDDLR